MAWFVESYGRNLKSSFIAISYASAVGPSSPMSDPSLSIVSVFFVWWNSQIIRNILLEAFLCD